MTTKRILAAAVLCVFLCVMLGLVAEQAYAQMGARGGAGGLDDKTSGDKNIASKKGMAVFDTRKGKTAKPTANKFQKAVGIGSVFVMIAVLKWL